MKRNAAALALFQAVAKLREYKATAGFASRFRADSELVLQSTISRDGLRKHPMRLRIVEDVIEFLEAGVGGRETLTERRWQAGYDLALARILAIHVRLHTYAAHLQRLPRRVPKL